MFVKGDYVLTRPFCDDGCSGACDTAGLVWFLIHSRKPCKKWNVLWEGESSLESATGGP